MEFFDFLERKGKRPGPLDELTREVIGAAIEVHKELGPGLTESLYENALCEELEHRRIPFQRQVLVPVLYKGMPIGETRLDLLVDGQLVLEFKACDQLTEIHRAQLICYPQITNLNVGLLINFNVMFLKDGLKRVVRKKGRSSTT